MKILGTEIKKNFDKWKFQETLDYWIFGTAVYFIGELLYIWTLPFTIGFILTFCWFGTTAFVHISSLTGINTKTGWLFTKPKGK